MTLDVLPFPSLLAPLRLVPQPKVQRDGVHPLRFLVPPRLAQAADKGRAELLDAHDGERPETDLELGAGREGRVRGEHGQEVRRVVEEVERMQDLRDAAAKDVPQKCIEWEGSVVVWLVWCEIAAEWPTGEEAGGALVCKHGQVLDARDLREGGIVRDGREGGPELGDEDLRALPEVHCRVMSVIRASHRVRAPPPLGKEKKARLTGANCGMDVVVPELWECADHRFHEAKRVACGAVLRDAWAWMRVRMSLRCVLDKMEKGARVVLVPYRTVSAATGVSGVRESL